ncbi:hypothetical protein CJF24_08860 [Aeromonas veronii]|uniref:Uncharacterized protein n=2 Tax=Aeromonas veronii TaxID=654 RepID=A0ABY3MMD4_AERVE|nr:hypothetical protein [Aeromonas veronii]RDU83687.1 hypothetical protein CGZ76_14555 [Aeromonas veronii]TEY52406.1 hypothetical protein CIG14_09515 [Aeromonas veronii]TYD45280.1 hypothetical protein CJF24_08860 [Aeromonas veronii]
MKGLHHKSTVIDYVWLYSRYLGNQLAYLKEIEENGSASIVYLLNILETIHKAHVDDYESNFQSVVKKTFESGLLSQVEYEFLNNKVNGVRKLRNIFAHANLSQFSFTLDNSKIIYPLTENENCQLLYSKISDIIFNIIFNIILKISIFPLDTDISINTDSSIKALKYTIATLTPDDILRDKGIDPETLPGWDKLTKTEQYRHAENASNVKVLANIFSALKDAR